MGYLTDEQLFKNVKHGDIANIYFFYGQEHYFVEQAVSRITSKTVLKQFESFNLTKIDGNKLDFSYLEDTMDNLPMMSSKKCVTIKDLDVEKLSKQDFDRLIKLISENYDTVVFIIYQVEIEVNLKKSSKYKKLAEAVSKAGIVCDFAFKDKLTLKRALCERAKKSYVELDMQTAEFLINRCSSSYQILTNELDKLIAYAGTTEITKKHIEELSKKTIDSSAFDLAKSILSNNFDKAYSLLDELLFQRQEAVAIVAALAMAFADMYRAKSAIACSKSIQDVTDDFAYSKVRQFAVKNAFRDVRAFSSEHIRGCIDALYEADLQLKSSKLSDRLILEQMLGKMLLMSINERAI